jgi:MazG family protein
MPDSRPIDRLLDVMARLRDRESGCPWDVEQTFATIAPYTVEEAYEVADAIERGDLGDLKEELGDLLFQVVFHSRIAQEQSAFAFDDVVQAVTDKLIRRHPHVFGDGDAQTSSDVVRRWDEIKAEEKKASAPQAKPQGLLSGVPRALPALVEAQQISSKAARAGFDWPSIHEVFDKMREELAELDAARAAGSHEEIESEIGDLLFTIVNLARFLKVDPEQALRGCNGRFRRRFGSVEDGLAERGKTTGDASLDEMESLWQAAKRTER